jgi:lysophospholipase L1-like esterase
LEHAIVFAGHRHNRVFVLSIPDYSVTPFVKPEDKMRVQDDITAFNKINQMITEQYGISYINITPYTRQAEIDATLLTTDGLHYAGKEHALWAGLLAAAIRSSIRKEDWTF